MVLHEPHIAGSLRDERSRRVSDPVRVTKPSSMAVGTDPPAVAPVDLRAGLVLELADPSAEGLGEPAARRAVLSAVALEPDADPPVLEFAVGHGQPGDRAHAQSHVEEQQ